MRQIRVLWIIFFCLTLGLNDVVVDVLNKAEAVDSAPKKVPRPKTTPPKNQTKRKRIRFVPSGVGAPTSRSDAGTRSDCKPEHLVKPQKNNVTKLIALIPENELSFTVDAAPTIAFYIPPGCIEEMHFSLLDTTTNQAYEALLQSPSSSGLFTLNLSKLRDFSALVMGKRYQWKLKLVADSRDTSADKKVSGMLQRQAVNTTLNAELKFTKLRDRPSLYASNSLWFETVSTLLAARQANPGDIDLNADWDELMTSQGLAAIINQPLMSNLVAKMSNEPR
jgi:hypothetical protein